MDALGWNTPSRVGRELLARYYFRGLSRYDVWVASRPPGLTTREPERIAERYARFLEHVGPAHLLGFTLGGAVATHLAADHADLVRRLVLAGWGPRLGRRGVRIVRRWRQLARQKRWSALHVDYATQVYTGWYRRAVTAGYRLCGPLLPRPVVGSDVVNACDALLAYDGSAHLSEIDAETLVIADTRGPLFPCQRQHEGASALPGGSVATLEGSHAVYEQNRQAFTDLLRRFLGGEQTR